MEYGVWDMGYLYLRGYAAANLQMQLLKQS